MILVTGGIASGRRTFIEKQDVPAQDIFDVADVVDALDEDGQNALVQLMGRPVILNAELLLNDTVYLHLFGCTGSLNDIVELLSSKEYVSVTEVGSGVIPLEREDRVYRERVGSLSVSLAQNASTVVHMVCGIPVTLKGFLA